MVTAETPQFDEAIPFRDSRWETKWVVIGAAFVLLWPTYRLLDHEVLSQFRWWLFALGPVAFLLFFPLVTRQARKRFSIRIPSLRRFAIEFGIAVAAVIVLLIFISPIHYVINRVSPGTSFDNNRMADIAFSAPSLFLYFFLFFAALPMPLIEEVYFRGFLYNAFRVRMSTALAITAQSAVFGWVHYFDSFSLLYAAYAFVVGIFLTVYYEWRKTLVAPIIVHSMVNSLSVIGAIAAIATAADSPYLGVGGDTRDETYIVRVVGENSAAHKAGLQVGDAITHFNGIEVADHRHLVGLVQLYEPGDTIPLRIERAGTTLDISVALGRRGDAKREPSSEPP